MDIVGNRAKVGLGIEQLTTAGTSTRRRSSWAHRAGRRVATSFSYVLLG
ncbi:hypothetical protein HBB16_00960 [Pseudonocardia sp. MCCB 268]|nr:hypothetical protein [Pseudonocardia cytotoxica]